MPAKVGGEEGSRVEARWEGWGRDWLRMGRTDGVVNVDVELGKFGGDEANGGMDYCVLLDATGYQVVRTRQGQTWIRCLDALQRQHAIAKRVDSSCGCLAERLDLEHKDRRCRVEAVGKTEHDVSVAKRAPVQVVQRNDRIGRRHTLQQRSGILIQLGCSLSRTQRRSVQEDVGCVVKAAGRISKAEGEVEVSNRRT